MSASESSTSDLPPTPPKAGPPPVPPAAMAASQKKSGKRAAAPRARAVEGSEAEASEPDAAAEESAVVEGASARDEAEPGEEPASAALSAQRLAAQLLGEGDRRFLDALKEANLLVELDHDELLRLASEAEGDEAESRRVELLELYYTAAGDAEASERRRGADRFFLQRVGQPATAAGLVERLVNLAPELDEVLLERIGGDEGPLVLRAGEHFSAVLDDYEEETDTDQFDIEEAQKRKLVPMITVRGLVRSLNVLLDKNGVRERLVALRGDESAELYVSLGVTEAITLARLGYLEDEHHEDVMELAAW